ncbi:tRNA (cytidine(34)-2'-O)-methyltransferase [Parvularcula lutaonensis]|uniref:tRNA (cytidine(34)-2'-O)-methyltransferase n=1 Tax=Parvularcula lutaonensis TaxID=491923 RepID=A0ABV7MCL8_9PROT|nr:TrmH family RNA methyltransferase [Parvularcula lutaonensis]GGY38999.1 tRNA (cytidine(34)-2'-O)-methyltransferase [Parvularcula lutaonensis]
MLRLALYQPEIAANLGAAIRIASCFGVPLHVIEPCGFPWRHRDIGRVAMDYDASLKRHRDWECFEAEVPGRRVLLTTHADKPVDAVAFEDGDIILLGQESAGVPEHVHDRADERVRIPLAPSARSLNVSVAGAIALAEASRQLGLFR